MRSLIIAAVLLISTVSAFAARQPSTVQWKTIHEYSNAALGCIHANPDDGERTSKEVVEFCTTADKLRKKLEAQGFCAYASSGAATAR